MNQQLADIAEAAINDPAFEDESGYCQKFARQCIGKMYGNRYERYRALSAKQTGLNFLHAGIGVNNAGQALEVGDVLYVTQNDGPFGHVGIFVGNGKVAENSSAHHSDTTGAKGHRNLTDFPKYQIIVRLPTLGGAAAPAVPAGKPTPGLVIGFTDQDGKIHYGEVDDANLIDGHFWVDSKKLAALLGVSAEPLHGGVAPVKDVLAALGLPIYDEKNDMENATKPRMYVFVHL